MHFDCNVYIPRGALQQNKTLSAVKNNLVKKRLDKECNKKHGAYLNHVKLMREWLNRAKVVVYSEDLPSNIIHLTMPQNKTSRIIKKHLVKKCREMEYNKHGTHYSRHVRGAC